jgi:hypothetical protein
MNSRHFDTVVQSLTTSSSRRASFTELAGGTLGMMLAGVAGEDVAARGGRRKNKMKDKD